MPLVQAKCTNSDASLQVDGAKDAAICPPLRDSVNQVLPS